VFCGICHSAEWNAAPIGNVLAYVLNASIASRVFRQLRSHRASFEPSGHAHSAPAVASMLAEAKPTSRRRRAVEHTQRRQFFDTGGVTRKVT
jgi:hypothetical protein